jgi:hypothetical protein
MIITTCVWPARGTENFIRSYIDRPTIPVELTKSFWISLHTASTGVTKDTLRRYMGNMDILKSDVERLTKLKYYSLQNTKLDAETGKLRFYIRNARNADGNNIIKLRKIKCSLYFILSTLNVFTILIIKLILLFFNNVKIKDVIILLCLNNVAIGDTCHTTQWNCY